MLKQSKYVSTLKIYMKKIENGRDNSKRNVRKYLIKKIKNIIRRYKKQINSKKKQKNRKKQE